MFEGNITRFKNLGGQMATDMKSYVHQLSTEMPARDAGGRGEELASETIAGIFHSLGLQTDIDGFACPGNLRISRSVYYALLLVASILCLIMPAFVALGIVLSIAGIVLLFMSYFKVDPLGFAITKLESQNVIAKYVPQGLSNSPRRSKIVITAYYDVQKPSIFLMPALRGFYPIVRKALPICAFMILICSILIAVPIPEEANLVFGIIAIICGIAMLLAIVDQLIGAFMKTPRGANANTSGLAVMVALADKLVNSDVRQSQRRRNYAESEDGSTEAHRVAGEDDVTFNLDEIDELVTDEPEYGLELEDVVVNVDAPQTEFAKLAALAQLHHEREIAEQERKIAEGINSGWGEGSPDATSAIVEEENNSLKDSIVDSEQVNSEQASESEQVDSEQASESEQVEVNESVVQQYPAHFEIKDPRVRRRDAAESTQSGLGVAEVAAAGVAGAAEAVGVAGAAGAVAAQNAGPSSSQSSQNKRSSKPSWWQKVEDDKAKGEFGDDSSELTLRSRFADSPAYKEEKNAKEAQEQAEVDAVAGASVVEMPQTIEADGDELTEASTDKDRSLGLESAEESVNVSSDTSVAEVDSRKAVVVDTSIDADADADAGTDTDGSHVSKIDPSATMAYMPEPIEQISKQADAKGSDQPEIVPAAVRTVPGAPLTKPEEIRDEQSDIPNADPNATMNISQAELEVKEPRAALLNLPVIGVGERESRISDGYSQAGLETGQRSSIDNIDYSKEDNQVNLTGAFAPLSASGVMQPITSEMLDQYNDGESLYIDDADDLAYNAQYNDDGRYVEDVEVSIPKKRRSLFKRRRKNRGNDNESAAQWLGISSDFNARREGADIGSWDNFSDDDDLDWRGGAYGGESERANRDSIEALSDELLNKEVWFVALGASGEASTGMRNLIKSRKGELRSARIINLEAIGAGDLCYTKSEPNLAILKKSTDPRLQKTIEKAANYADVEISGIDLDWKTTQATQAIASGARAISIIAVDENTIPGWRWSDDTEEIVEEENLNDVYELLIELIKNV